MMYNSNRMVPFSEKLSIPDFDAPLPARASWLKAQGSSSRAVALVVHGLNLKPERMDAIAHELSAQGIDVLRTSLSGHRGNIEEFKKVSRGIWIQDVYEAYCRARKEADQRKVPLYFLGYSVGALVNLDLMNNFQDAKVRYERMVLLAPAAAVHRRSRWIRFFKVFGPGFLVPSVANREYRASRGGTPVAAYEALFHSLEALESGGGVRQKDVPTLVVIDPEDELVSEAGLIRVIERDGLRAWKMLRVAKSGAALKTGCYHHLLVDSASLGLDPWSKMVAAILAHLRPESSPSLEEAKEGDRQK